MCGVVWKSVKIYIVNTQLKYMSWTRNIGDTDTSENDNNNSDTTAAQYAASASLRLPEFWPDTPNSWFVFAELFNMTCSWRILTVILAPPC
jgi:hypothetical protein